MLKFIENDGGRSKITKKTKIGDCSIRSCAIVTGQDYAKTYKELFEICMKKYENGISNDTINEYLTSKGFKKISTPKQQLGDIPKKGIYYAHVRMGFGTHGTAVVDGVINDIFQPRESHRMSFYYCKEE
jgi:hypothetical protein